MAAGGDGGMDTTNPAKDKLIAERAYEPWENQGRPRGCDLVHWREAEQEIMQCFGTDAGENRLPDALSP
jgi:hypothetical protein